MTAVAADNEKRVQKFLSYGANLNVADNLGGTALFYSLDKSESMIKILIEAGADVNFSTKKWPPLYEVVSNISKMKMLVEAGADVNYANRACPILPWVIANKQEEAAKFLINAGADVNITNARRQTPLDLVYPTMSIELLKLLVDRSADVGSFLKEKVVESNLPFVKKLLKAGIDVNYQDYSGVSLLMLACYLNNLKMAKLLVGFGADKNLQDDDGKTALMYAVYQGNELIVKFLLQVGVKVNLQDYKGNTALIIAAKYSNYNLVRLLLEYKADKKIRNIYNKKARECTKDTKIRELLKGE
jgi:ankyrin repeat protein